MIAITLDDTSILVCSVYIDFLQEKLSTIRISLKNIDKISNLSVAYNTYRDSSFLFVKGQHFRNLKQQIIYMSENEIISYNVIQDVDRLIYATSYNRWLYRIYNSKV